MDAVLSIFQSASLNKNTKDKFHRFISKDTPVHPKMKTDYMQDVSLLTIELQLILRIEGSNNYHFLKKSFQKNLKNLILFSKIRFKLFL